ncbi:MAG TPA: VOC family protein [Steroidobacteraceae bacterium]|nr:VOC family protein [Steroidobacteraceae bacterium]
MVEPSYILLYVDNPQLSAEFYSRLLGCEPVEMSPTFALFVLQSGLKLGLWSRHTVEPAMTGAPGAGELAFPVGDAQKVHDLYKEWGARKLRVAQAPTQMDFGFTFVALDPDGHRLRVFAPNDQ